MASKSADVRPKITLACTDCKERNYITKKNRCLLYTSDAADE